MLPRKVDLVLNTIDHLRPIPSSVTRILKEIDNPNTMVSTIAEYIGLDQALTAMVIKTANAAALGYSKECSSINDAVMRIGFKRLKAILFALNAVGPMTGRLNGYRLGSGQLWDHSLKIAIASEWLARRLNYKDPESVYIVGLLHDIGKLLMDQFVLEDYQKIVQYVHDYRIPVWKIEEKLIGIDHANLGGLMASRWNFPEALVEGIRYHHAPSAAANNQALSAMVNLGNSLATQKDEYLNELFSSDLHPDTLSILNVNLDDLDSLRAGVYNILGFEPDVSEQGAD